MPTARSTPASIRARTADRQRAGGAAGREDPRRRRLHDARRRRTGLNARSCIGRLNADGSLDAPSIRARTAVVHAWRCRRTGRSWSAVSSHARRRRDRHDAAQPTSAGSTPTARSTPASIRARTATSAHAVQPDGKILVGGNFTMLGGGGPARRHATHRPAQRRRLARRQLQSGRERRVSRLALQADGKILVGGEFTALSDVATGFDARNQIGRFTADGTLDATFDPGANNAI